MKAISIKDPWASLIAQGEKTIEVRTWKTSYRGPLLVCVSKNPETENSGKAICIVDLCDVRPLKKADEKSACLSIFPKN